MNAKGERQCLLLFIGINVFLAVAAFAQEREVPLGEIALKTQKAESWLRNIAYRSSLTGEILDESTGRWIFNSRLVVELEAPDRIHWFQENAPGTRVMRIEVIQIDGKDYRRVDDKLWEALTLPDLKGNITVGPGLMGGGGGPRPKTTSSGKFIEETILNDRAVSVYQITITSVYPDSKTEDTRIKTSTYWIRDDDLYAKKIEEYQVLGVPKRVWRSTTTYQYDGIKIVAPVIAPSKNQ